MTKAVRACVPTAEAKVWLRFLTEFGWFIAGVHWVICRFVPEAIPDLRHMRIDNSEACVDGFLRAVKTARKIPEARQELAAICKRHERVLDVLLSTLPSDTTCGRNLAPIVRLAQCIKNATAPP